MQEDQSTLFAIAGLELKLEGLAAVVRESGKEVASAVDRLQAIRPVVVPMVGLGGSSPATGGETERTFGVMDIIHGIESAYKFDQTWFGSPHSHIWSWLKDLFGVGEKGFTSTLGGAAAWTTLLFGGGYALQKGFEAITGKELEPEPIPYAVMGPNGLEFVEKEQRKFDWSNPVKSIQEGEFYQWLFGKPEVEQALPPSQTFVDSSAMLGQGIVMAPQQTAANTTIHLTMNNSFAVDREETADYCIGELYRRMRAELDGARLGVAY
ncbi:hypothetical protein WMO16_07165 [Oscillospiraceae bacterium CLA-JM-H45]